MTVVGTKVVLKQITKKYGNLNVLGPIDIIIEPGEFFALLGPSGSGKSTLLGAIAGFNPATSGAVLVDGVDVTYTPPYERNYGMVFQNYSLFPFLSVFRNVAFPLEMRRLPRDQIRSRVMAALASVRLTDIAERMPSALSGGQQQRVALARASVYEPPLMLMDEPLGALDKNLRENLQDEIKRRHRESGATFIYVTHDQYEAVSMADRIAIMRDGHLEQVGSPNDLYRKPKNTFIAGFLGEANLLDVAGVEATGSGERILTTCSLTLTAKASGAKQAMSVCIRPENVVLGSSARVHQNCFEGVVEDAVHSAGVMRYRVRLNDELAVISRIASKRGVETFSIGDRVDCGWDVEDMQILPNK